MRRYVIMFTYVDSDLIGHERHEIIKAENVELAIDEVKRQYGVTTRIKNIYSEPI